MKSIKLLVYTLFLVVMSSIVLADVQRQFSATSVSNGGSITVTYTPSAGDWSLDEILPAGWTVQGVTIYQQHLREYFSTNAPVTYTFVAPSTSQTAIFNQGQWQLGSDNTLWHTFTSVSVNVGGGGPTPTPTPTPDDGTTSNTSMWLIVGGIAVVLVIAMSMKKK